MVRVHTHIVTLQVEGILAILGMAEFILVEIWPVPNLRVDHMGKPFPTSHLCGYVHRQRESDSMCVETERESDSMCAVVMS